MRPVTVGVLAFHGDVSEHIEVLEKAAESLKRPITVLPVRTAKEVDTLDALIIPGGESTTLGKLCEREGMFPSIRKVKNIFGTCAGAILLAKEVLHKAKGQQTLGLVNIEVDRNAYGRQNESSEREIETEFGAMNAVFIRAPKIRKAGKNVKILATEGKEVVACEERKAGKYYLVTCFHPEYTTSRFHQHFLKQVVSNLK